MARGAGRLASPANGLAVRRESVIRGCPPDSRPPPVCQVYCYARGGARASPGVRFGRLAARAREEAVELRERVLGEPELECAEARVELRQGARPDDGRRDGRVLQHPCQRHLGGRVAQLATERLVGRHPVTVALEQALLPLARAPALGRLLQGAAEQPPCERAV